MNTFTIHFYTILCVLSLHTPTLIGCDVHAKQKPVNVKKKQETLDQNWDLLQIYEPTLCSYEQSIDETEEQETLLTSLLMHLNEIDTQLSIGLENPLQTFEETISFMETQTYSPDEHSGMLSDQSFTIVKTLYEKMDIVNSAVKNYCAITTNLTPCYSELGKSIKNKLCDFLVRVNDCRQRFEDLSKRGTKIAFIQFMKNQKNPNIPNEVIPLRTGNSSMQLSTPTPISHNVQPTTQAPSQQQHMPPAITNITNSNLNNHTPAVIQMVHTQNTVQTVHTTPLPPAPSIPTHTPQVVSPKNPATPKAKASPKLNHQLRRI